MPKIQDKFKLILLILLLITAIFFRFWQIRDYVVFLGDEGRDMIIMRNIFVNKNLPFLGPTASVGGFYLGPIYYWMAAPFLYLFNFDPAGPSYFVAIIGVATVLLLYIFLKEAVGFWPGVVASFLYATAPLIVRYSRSSWNPNPLPFFALLVMYSLFKALKKDTKYFVLAGASLGITVQLHYLAVILAPLSFLIIIVNAKLKEIFKAAILSLLGFTATFSPFLFFEIRHNFPNFRTILEFITRGSTVGYKSNNIAWSIFDIGNILLEELSTLQETAFTKIFFLGLVALGIWGFLKFKKEKKLIFSISLIWFLGGLTLLRLYAGQIFDYYFGTIFPAPFLLIGLIVFLFWKNIFLRFGISVISILLIAFFIDHGFYKTPPNKLIDQTSRITDFVNEKSDNRPYNFALISESNSNHAYRYFLETKDNSPKQLEEIVTEQLLIVCESKKCEPLGYPLWEVAAFGRAEIAEEWELKEYGIKVFRLIHWSGAPSPAGKPAIKEG